MGLGALFFFPLEEEGGGELFKEGSTRKGNPKRY